MEILFRGATDVDTTSGTSVVVTSPHTAPCRRCLTDIEPGEEAVLTRYDPFRVDSPYRGTSPVFVHARECTPYVGAAVPDQQRRRLLSVRAYDDAAMMVDSEVVEGEQLEPLLTRLSGDGRTSFVHVHNARPGCFAVRVDRG